VEQVGAFDERFGSYVEDVEYCMRARDCGWRVGLVVDAHASEFGSASPRAHALVAANRVLLRALRAKGWPRIRSRVLLIALAAKSEARMLSARCRKRPDEDARFFRDAWTRAFVASFRQPPRTARPSPHS
jgi:GT2 family glycosyltransferase